MNKNKAYNYIAFLYFVLSITISCIILGFLYYSNSLNEDFLRSDLVYLPTITKDILWNNGNFFDWKITPAPYFFPDMAVYFILNYFIHSAYDNVYIFMIYQVIVTFIVLFLIHKELCDNILKAALCTITPMVFIIVFLSGNIIESYRLILFNGFHFGTMINGLFITWLFLRSNLQASKINLIFIILLTFLGTASDLCLIVWFIAPICAILFYMSWWLKLIDFKYVIRINLRLLLTFVTAWALKIFITGTANSNYFRPKGIWNAAKDIYYFTIGFINFGIKYPIVFIFIIIGIICAIKIIIYSLNQKTKINNKILFIASIVILSPLFTIIVFANSSTGLVLPNTPYFHITYSSPLFWLPLLFCPILIIQFIPLTFHKIFNYILFILSTVSLTIGLINIQKLPSLKFTYYPEVIKCIDEGLREENVKNGISGFVLSHYITNGSKIGLQMVHMNQDLTPLYWLINTKWYTGSYDFAITRIGAKTIHADTINEKMIKAINGKPIKEFTCETPIKATDFPSNTIESPGIIKILVYGKDKLKTKLFNAVGAEFTWDGCSILSIRDSTQTNTNCIITNTTSTKPNSVITFGPYVPLPQGKYKFIITYSSPANKNIKVGKWDIISSSSTIKIGDIYGSNSSFNTIIEIFEVNHELSDKLFEIRTFYDGISNLQIKNLTIKRVG